MGLSHWCWVCICGQNFVCMRIVSLYRPCMLDGPLSTYQQQLWTLGHLKWDICPEEAILQGLVSETQLWQEVGNHVIIIANFNKDIQSPDLNSLFHEFGLEGFFTLLHGNQAPATQNCSSMSIDGIFMHTTSSNTARVDTLPLAMALQVITECYGLIFINVYLPYLNQQTNSSTRKETSMPGSQNNQVVQWPPPSKVTGQWNTT